MKGIAEKRFIEWAVISSNAIFELLPIKATLKLQAGVAVAVELAISDVELPADGNMTEKSWGNRIDRLLQCFCRRYNCSASTSVCKRRQPDATKLQLKIASYVIIVVGILTSYSVTSLVYIFRMEF